MEMEVHPLLPHLRKLPPTTTEESLANVLETLWKTRASGLSELQKSNVQSLLNLADPTELDTILFCLRILIRKVVKEKLSLEDLHKLLPLDLAVDMRNNLLMLVQKYKNLWEEEATGDLPLSQQMRWKFPGRVVIEQPKSAPLSVSDLSSWPTEVNLKSHSDGINHGGHVLSYAEPSVLQKSSMVISSDSSDSLLAIPRLKSMTWSMQSRNSEPGNRITVVTLKLQDYTKSHIGEVEVKFQLSRDTLEAMLRTLTCINDQL